MSFKAKLKVAGKEYNVLSVSYALSKKQMQQVALLPLHVVEKLM